MKKIFMASIILMTKIAIAADFKLAYVDVSKIFTTAKPAVAMQEALKAKIAPNQSELQSMNAKLAEKQNKIQIIMKKSANIEKLNLSDKKDLEKLQASYQADQIEFQKKYASFQQMVQRSQDFASAAILNKTNNILRDISEKGGYDLVLTSNQLVYAKPKYDLTDQVIAKLNQDVSGADLIKQLNALDRAPLKAN